MENQTNEPHRSVFISHASKNFKIADEIREILESRGVSCWIAPRDIPPGKQYGTSIINGISNSSVFLLLLTNESNLSQAVQNEVERAFGYQKTIIPVRISDVKPGKEIEFFVSNAQWVDAIYMPLKRRMDEVAAIVQAIEISAKLPTVQPEKKSILGTIEKFLERALRHKTISFVSGFLVLVCLISFVIFLQNQSTSVIAKASGTIERSGADIAVAASSIKDSSAKVNAIDGKIDTLKKETSNDPRKELANRGIPWNTNSFADALKSGDLETIALFIDGKIDLHNDRVISIISDMFTKKEFQRNKPVLELLHQKNVDFLNDFEAGFHLDRVGKINPIFLAASGSDPDIEAAKWLVNNNNKSILKTSLDLTERLSDISSFSGAYHQCYANDESFKVYALLVVEGLPIDLTDHKGYKEVFGVTYKLEKFDIPEDPKNENLKSQLARCTKFLEFLRPKERETQVSLEKQIKDDVKAPILLNYQKTIDKYQREVDVFNEQGVKNNGLVRIYPIDYSDSPPYSSGVREYMDVPFSRFKADTASRIDALKLKINKVNRL